MGLENVYLHVIFDGRSTEPGSAPALLEKLEAQVDEIGIGQVVTGVGRGIALDRDGNYGKIKRAFDALVYGAGKPCRNGLRKVSMDFNFVQGTDHPCKDQDRHADHGWPGRFAAEPGGKTELETARTPNLDALAGIIRALGLSVPVGPGITVESGPGHLAIFGYDPLEYRIGRGVLEAVGVDFDLEPR